jgi:hypothetical protein
MKGKEFKLYGLLPPNVQTLEEQVKRAYQQYSSRPNALAKYIHDEHEGAESSLILSGMRCNSMLCGRPTLTCADSRLS